MFWRKKTAHDSHYVEVQKLIERGVDLGAPYGDDGLTLLHFWAGAGRRDIVKLLLDGGAPIDAGDHSRWTALHLAAGKGERAVTELLVDAGADVRAKDVDGRTPAAVASLGGHEAVARLLETRERAEEEKERRWLDDVRERLERYLAHEGLGTCDLGDRPAWYFAPCLSIWRATTANGETYWVLGGDIPADRLAATEAASPPEALRAFGTRWRAVATGELTDDFSTAAPAELLASRGQIFLEWADEDELWRL